jgi:hypothetical protein
MAMVVFVFVTLMLVCWYFLWYLFIFCEIVGVGNVGFGGVGCVDGVDGAGGVCGFGIGMLLFACIFC